jgi:hypothetical protein
MNSTDTYEQDGPAIEPDLLIRFVIARLDELVENSCNKMPLVLQALALSGVATDPDATEELQELFFPTTLVESCRDILSRALVKPDTEQSFQPCQETPFRRLSERESRQVLLSAMREVKRITANQDFEFIPIIEILGWIALLPYPRKLQEFEAIWDSGAEPADLMQAGRRILWEAYRDRDRADPYHRKLDLVTKEVGKNYD